MNSFSVGGWSSFNEQTGREEPILDRKPAEGDVPTLAVISFNTSAAIASWSLAVELHLDTARPQAERSFGVSCFMKAGKFRRIEDDCMHHFYSLTLAYVHPCRVQMPLGMFDRAPPVAHRACGFRHSRTQTRLRLMTTSLVMAVPSGSDASSPRAHGRLNSGTPESGAGTRHSTNFRSFRGPQCRSRRACHGLAWPVCDGGIHLSKRRCSEEG